MAEVAATARAMNFSAGHEMAVVFARFDRAVERQEEARPSAAAFVFRVRLEKRLSAAGASEDAVALLLVERAGSGSFGAVLPENAVLFWRELRRPLTFGLVDGKIFASHIESLTF